MKRTILKTTVSSLLIFIAAFSLEAYGIVYEADTYEKLENVLFEQMSRYNQDIEIKYTGTIDNIEETIQDAVDKDIYVNSNIKSASWTITEYPHSKTANINVEINYIITGSKRLEADKKIDVILSEIIDPSMNDHEKVKSVHDYIVQNGMYDSTFQYYSDYDLLMEGKSVCNGYALLAYNMIGKLGIPVKLVSGTGHGEPHIWNMVKLGEHWFHMDTTWDDPLPDNGTVSYSYYMLTDNEILKDHTIDENLVLPQSTKRYFDYLTELGYDKLLAETGLDIYMDENTAKDENELRTILERKIKYHPLKISVRVSKTLSQESLNAAMSNLFRNDFISEIGYGQLNSDSTCECNVLNLYLKYKETPDRIAFDFSDKVYNTATKVNFNVYAIYGNRKINITDNVLIYPYDKEGISISNGTLSFKDSGSYNIDFEFQGIKETASISALSSSAFEYITDKKTENPVNVKIYNQYIDFSSISQWPFIENGRTMVPLRAVFEVMNCKVSWDTATSTAVVEKDGTKILIPANSNTAYINGTAKALDVPAKLVNNRIMVPLRFISEAIDKTVIWDNAERTVLIY
ncbi:MAG: stalk domain-containing protein [Sedimentibacter saalensis]|uniref:stalk domain-containing protein n=1 Tax=Sedimentibacter saalensis TaxID=130788 RepID=UPI003158BCF1